MSTTPVTIVLKGVKDPSVDSAVAATKAAIDSLGGPSVDKLTKAFISLGEKMNSVLFDLSFHLATAGGNTEKLGPKFDELAAKIDRGVNFQVRTLKRELMELGVTNYEGFKKLNTGFGDLSQTIRETHQRSQGFGAGMGDLKGIASELGMKLGAVGLAGTIFELGKTAIEASSEFEQYGVRLTALAHSATLAHEQLRMAVEMSRNLPFDVGEVSGAVVNLEKFRVSASEMLPVAADLAATFGKSLPETAQILGKAYDGAAGGIRSLRNEFGITNELLRQHGAEIDKAGRLHVQGAEALDKYRKALLEVLKEYEGGAIKQAHTLSGEMSILRDAAKLLAKDVGDDLNPAWKLFIETALGATKGAQAFYDTVMKNRGGTLTPQQAIDKMKSSKADYEEELKYAKEASAKYDKGLANVLHDPSPVNYQKTLRDMGFEDPEAINEAIKKAQEHMKAAAAENKTELHAAWNSAYIDLVQLQKGVQGLDDGLERLSKNASNLKESFKIAKQLGDGDSTKLEIATYEKNLADMKAYAHEKKFSIKSSDITAHMQENGDAQDDLTKFYRDYADTVEKLRKLRKQEATDAHHAAQERVQVERDAMAEQAATDGLTLQQKSAHLDAMLKLAGADQVEITRINKEITANNKAIAKEQETNRKKDLVEMVRAFEDGIKAQENDLKQQKSLHLIGEAELQRHLQALQKQLDDFKRDGPAGTGKSNPITDPALLRGLTNKSESLGNEAAAAGGRDETEFEADADKKLKEIEKRAKAQEGFEIKLDEMRRKRLKDYLALLFREQQAGKDNQAELIAGIQQDMRLELDAIELRRQKNLEAYATEAQANQIAQFEKMALYKQEETTLDALIAKKKKLSEPDAEIAAQFANSKLGGPASPLMGQEEFAAHQALHFGGIFGDQGLGTWGAKGAGAEQPVDQLTAFAATLKTQNEDFSKSFGTSINDFGASVAAFKGHPSAPTGPGDGITAPAGAPSGGPGGTDLSTGNGSAGTGHWKQGKWNSGKSAGDDAKDAMNSAPGPVTQTITNHFMVNAQMTDKIQKSAMALMDELQSHFSFHGTGPLNSIG